MKDKKIKKNIGLGITDMVIAITFIVMILLSDGGIKSNGRMMGAAWIFAWCGIMQILGRKKKGIIIASVVFYLIGIFYNLFYTIYHPAHIIIVILMIVFLILTCANMLSKK